MQHFGSMSQLKETQQHNCCNLSVRPPVRIRSHQLIPISSYMAQYHKSYICLGIQDTHRFWMKEEISFQGILTKWFLTKWFPDYETLTLLVVLLSGRSKGDTSKSKTRVISHGTNTLRAHLTHHCSKMGKKTTGKLKKD